MEANMSQLFRTGLFCRPCAGTSRLQTDSKHIRISWNLQCFSRISLIIQRIRANSLFFHERLSWWFRKAEPLVFNQSLNAVGSPYICTVNHQNTNFVLANTLFKLHFWNPNYIPLLYYFISFGWLDMAVSPAEWSTVVLHFIETVVEG